VFGNKGHFRNKRESGRRPGRTAPRKDEKQEKGALKNLKG